LEEFAPITEKILVAMPLHQSGGVEGSTGVAAVGGKQPATGGKMYSSFGGKKRPVPRPMGGKKMKTPTSRPIMGGKSLPAAAAALSAHGGKLQPPAACEEDQASLQAGYGRAARDPQVPKEHRAADAQAALPATGP
jgi:hypothetical protein